MSRILRSAGMALALAMAEAPTATAAPMTGSQSPIGGVAVNSVVQKVRRFHRRWREDRAGWHEHVGRSSAILAAMRAAITHRGKRYWHRGAAAIRTAWKLAHSAFAIVTATSRNLLRTIAGLHWCARTAGSANPAVLAARWRCCT